MEQFMTNVFYTKQRIVKYALCTGVVMLMLSACTGVPVHNTTQRTAGPTSSLVNYLYPNGEQPPGLAQEIPQLTVPVRVGIAFVPEDGKSPIVSREVKMRLLKEVKNAFRHHQVVQQIRIIPPDVLRSRGGFRELRDVAQRYNVDLIALVSHNQIRAIQNNSLSITYLTIVGALVLPGNNHHVSTFIDTAVFDVGSNKLLFRAAGKDRVYRQTSAFALTEKNTLISRNSVKNATNDMIGSLNTELKKFRSRIRSGSNEADVYYRPGYRGDRIIKREARRDDEYDHPRHTPNRAEAYNGPD
jgi:rhombotail lipoprotein